ncbi:hypothetical protein PHYBOEH_004778 [Phytophthora boehmeriae]|uniref:Uncharacterized protein n=1 Tax=Phytophthora boehmeriae TaxID=109152 RepID=A0A8T1WND4_9STRA|nr:hypothetical protein PHYBOEH_004778 [Phytophthora boehmeriae]
MSIALVEDQEAFEAALSFVDEYEASESSDLQSLSPVSSNGAQSVAAEAQQEDAALALALDGLPSPTELALAETGAAAPASLSVASSDTADATKKKTKKSAGAAAKRKKPLNYNPNRAREQQRKELLYLREKVVEMERKLTALKSTRGANAQALEEKSVEELDEVSTASTFEVPNQDR